MTVTRVVINRVTLRGFGPYRTVTALFPAGLGVWVAPNERGKSTLVAGTLAILFGLPASSDPDVFGVERYRSREWTRDFDGEILLHAGDTYRVRRNFDTHRIRIERAVGDSWKDVVVGEHNPSGRKPNTQYVGWLEGLFGHHSRSLFEATFCVLQDRLEQKNLSAELRALLTGSGSSGHQSALGALIDAGKGITRETGALGLTPRDGRKAGRLDEIDVEIKNLTSGLEASRAVLDALQQVTAGIAAESRSQEELKARLGRARRTEEALEDWRRLVQRLEDRKGEVAGLRRAVREFESREQRLAHARDERMRAYPEFVSAPEHFDEGLESIDALLRLTGDVARIKDEARSAWLERETLTARADASFPRPIEGTACTSVKRARALCGRVRSEWEAFERVRAAWRENRELRRTQFAALEEAAPATTLRLAAYGPKRRELEHAIAIARAEADASDRRQADLEMRRERLASEFADVLPYKGLTSAVHALCDHLRELDARRVNVANLRQQRRGVVWIQAVLGALLILSSTVLLGLVPPETGGTLLSWVALLAIAGASVVIPLLPGTRRLRRAWREAERALEDVGEKIAACTREAPQLQHLDAEQLAEVHRRLLAYDAKALVVEEMEQSRTETSDGREAPDSRLAALAESLRALDEQVHGVPMFLGDIEAALTEWQDLCKAGDELEKEMRQRTASWLPHGAFDWERVEEQPLDQISGDWAEFAHALETLNVMEVGDDAHSLRTLIAAARSLEERAWDDLEARAASADADRAAARDAEARYAQLVGLQYEDGFSRPGGLLADLKDEIQRVVDELHERFAGDWAAAARCALQGNIPELIRHLPQPFAEVAERAGNDVKAARRRWKDWSQRVQDEGSLAREQRATLRAFSAEEAGELVGSLSAAESRLQRAVGELDALLEQHPGLPPWRERPDYARVDEQVAALRAERADFEAQTAKGEERLQELRTRQAELQGAAPLNVAAGELSLRALREERDRLRLELDAITLAYRVLHDAAAGYYARYADHLAEAVSGYFATLTGKPGRVVHFDDDMNIGVREPGGSTRSTGQLSQGARDQLYLSLRLGAADLLSGGTAVPFVFDDPFLNCDEERLSCIRTALGRLAHERQVLIFSHRAEFAAWGEPVRLSESAEKVEGILT